MSFQLFQRSFFVVWYRMGSSSDDAPPDRAAVWPPPEPEEVKEQRDGVPLTEDLIRRKAEHNEGMVRRPAARVRLPGAGGAHAGARAPPRRARAARPDRLPCPRASFCAALDARGDRAAPARHRPHRGAQQLPLPQDRLPPVQPHQEDREPAPAQAARLPQPRAQQHLGHREPRALRGASRSASRRARPAFRTRGRPPWRALAAPRAAAATPRPLAARPARSRCASWT